ncbi:FAD-dependent tricarballylate dehydrogenase TcuA [Jiangella asiatica]|uniref:FAD-dependent oxidoreductase n=1 Tax=Jiangella asiatica TaxID=2530372 RepID=A0A4R5D6G5_9ACTN|nr:FAD-dependent tricarballylate dehydrogenase TcuA [Jiangella asiatica]TDE07430.1 FAD-dependent oxidoreductase [Jiangella asiatica]
MNGERVDVVVVGSGNAGMTAAHAAAERGRSVVVLERAPWGEHGGNSYYTAGATRVAHGGLDDLLPLIDADDRLPLTVVPAYPAEEYLADLERLTDGRGDPELAEVLVAESLDTVRWQHRLGLRFRLMYERQAYPLPDGGYRFWGGLHIGNTGGGVGMIADHLRTAGGLGVRVRCGHHVTGLLGDARGVTGVSVLVDGEPTRIEAESVIVAAGSFEADPELRARHLGAGWRHAVVRGTPHNRGDLIEQAVALGALRGGDWASAHAVQWDAGAQHNSGNRELTNRFTRQSYPLGIIVDAAGERFADEGEDFRNYTYAKLGREILTRPGGVAFQLFDATTRPMLRTEEYEMPGVSHIEADTLPELARRAGIDADRLVATVTAFNDSIDEEVPFDPTVLDGRRASTTPPKSNWAVALRTPPFHAYPVACGITFAFGGLAATTRGQVRREGGGIVPGLFAVGEALGGLFSGNYPGGTGLAAGSVFGRRAGSIA